MQIEEFPIPDRCSECMLVEKIDGWLITCRYYTGKKGRAFKMGDGRSKKPDFCKVKRLVLLDEE